MSNDNAHTLLEVKDLSIGFRSEDGVRSAVQHISFEVQAGKTLAIVGESGSGKSVSSLSLMSLLHRQKAVFESGTLTFDSSFAQWLASSKRDFQPSDELLATLRGKGIAMIFQEPMTSLNPVKKCGEQIAEMIRKHRAISHAEARSETLRLFNEVKLPRPEEMLDQYPHQLSGGQRQRVMIAMAISCDPKILIADEPTTALDVTVQKGILQLLRNLQLKHAMGMIFITHDLGVVAEIADDVLVMRRGEMIERGNAVEIFENPQHPYTKGLMACRPTPSMKSKRLMTVEDFLVDDLQQIKQEDFSSRFDPANKLIEVIGLTKTYESSGGLLSRKKSLVHAVNNVHFHICEGETMGLVGESGCGKTTLSRMLLGLIPSTSGEILYRGNDLAQFSNAQWRDMRKELQIIFQDPYSSLNPKHTIGDAIMEPMEVFGLHASATARRNKAIELLQRVGLQEEYLQRYPHEFSGGQRQRVVIARALAVEPSFIICDESVSALDVSVQAQVLNLLNELKRDYKLTYLFISHDLGVVYHMSDRIMVMNKGRVEEMGSADDIFYRAQSEYTQQLLDSIPGRRV